MSSIVLASLLTTQAMAEGSELYVGLDAFTSSSTFNLDNVTTGASADVDDDSDGFKLKFGANLDEGWRVQGYFQQSIMLAFLISEYWCRCHQGL